MIKPYGIIQRQRKYTIILTSFLNNRLRQNNSEVQLPIYKTECYPFYFLGDAVDSFKLLLTLIRFFAFAFFSVCEFRVSSK